MQMNRKEQITEEVMREAAEIAKRCYEFNCTYGICDLSNYEMDGTPIVQTTDERFLKYCEENGVKYETSEFDTECDELYFCDNGVKYMALHRKEATP